MQVLDALAVVALISIQATPVDCLACRGVNLVCKQWTQLACCKQSVVRLQYPQLAATRPFLVPYVQAFANALGRPNAIDSDAYNRDYQEVFDYGSNNSTVRTPFQTETGDFWLGGAGTQHSARICISNVKMQLGLERNPQSP